jgi:hypothetical protein
MAASGSHESISHAARWCFSVEFGPQYAVPSQKRKVATLRSDHTHTPHHEAYWSEFDTKTPSSFMAVVLMTATGSHERMRVGTQQHLPTFASGPLHPAVSPPWASLMDRDTQHRPISPTTRAHQLTTVGRHALLLGTVDDTYTGRLLTTQDTQKYVKWAVCGTEPTDTRADGHVPVTLVPHPPRIQCLHASVRLGSQQPSTFTSTSSKGSCVPWRTSAATTQLVLRSQCLESSHAHSTAERTGRSKCALQASQQPCDHSRHRSRRHSASPHARMRRWRVWRAKVAKTLLAQSPPLGSRVDGRALMRRRAAQKVAEPPQARQSGYHDQRGAVSQPALSRPLGKGPGWAFKVLVDAGLGTASSSESPGSVKTGAGSARAYFVPTWAPSKTKRKRVVEDDDSDK